MHRDDSLTIGQIGRAFDVSLIILVHLSAAFGTQYLIQTFPGARLLRWFFRGGQEQAWAASPDYDDSEARDDPVHRSLYC